MIYLGGRRPAGPKAWEVPASQGVASRVHLVSHASQVCCVVDAASELTTPGVHDGARHADLLVS